MRSIPARGAADIPPRCHVEKARVGQCDWFRHKAGLTVSAISTITRRCAMVLGLSLETFTPRCFAVTYSR